LRGRPSPPGREGTSSEEDPNNDCGEANVVAACRASDFLTGCSTQWSPVCYCRWRS